MNRWLLAFALFFGAAELGELAASSAAEAAPQKRRRRRKRPAPQTSAPAPTPASEQSVSPPGGFRGPSRIDFDDRLIQGQTNKSGAVVLFSRKETNISSMVRRRKSFRHLTIRTVYDE
ncbi:MAG: hypothetical protein ACFB9M_21105 [Myxococcota bacterium]